MRHQIAHRDCVRNHEALKSPFVPQNVVEEPMVASGWDVVQIHVGTHQTAYALLDGRMEGLEVEIAQENLGYVRRIVVTASFGGAVSGKMLRTGQHAVCSHLFQRAALEAAHLGSRHG